MVLAVLVLLVSVLAVVSSDLGLDAYGLPPDGLPRDGLPPDGLPPDGFSPNRFVDKFCLRSSNLPPQTFEKHLFEEKKWNSQAISVRLVCCYLTIR